MTFVRFSYPGQHANDRAYSGALSPTVRRAVRSGSIYTNSAGDGPRFGRKIFQQPTQIFEFTWAALTHEEAQELYRQWEDTSGGTAAVYYTPDDQSEPITVVLLQPPAINYLSRALATVTALAEQQR